MAYPFAVSKNVLFETCLKSSVGYRRYIVFCFGYIYIVTKNKWWRMIYFGNDVLDEDFISEIW